LEVLSNQLIPSGPPWPSVVLRPGTRSLAPGEERYTVPGGGAIALPIHTGDIVRLVDVEGMQRCEMVCADAAGAIDPAMLGVRGNSDASGLKQILSGKGESARLVRAELERRGIDLSNARSITLFGGESRPGDSGEFTASHDGLLIVAAPGAPMDAGSQGTATPIRVHIHAAGFARRMKCSARAPSRSPPGHPR
jgi:aminomethyltransferase